MKVLLNYGELKIAKTLTNE